jgi:hypothetical protein
MAASVAWSGIPPTGVLTPAGAAVGTAAAPRWAARRPTMYPPPTTASSSTGSTTTCQPMVMTLASDAGPER